MKRYFLAMVLTATACQQVHTVTRETIDAEQFFLVALAADGSVRTVSPIYDTAGGEQATLAIEGDIDAVYVVGLANERLRAADDRFDDMRVKTVEISVAEPPAAPELILRGDDAFYLRALPEDLPILDAKTNNPASGGERETIERALTLALPIDLDSCADDHPMRLEPFGATRELLAEIRDPNARDLIRATGSGDRALLLTKGALFVVERGGGVDLEVFSSTISPYTESSILHARALGTNVVFAALTAYFRLVDGEPQFLLGGEHDGSAAIWRLALGRNGVRLVEPVYIDPPQTSQIRDLAVDGQDIAVAVGEDGLILTGEVIGRPFIRVETPRGADDEIRRVAASHILTQPHAITTRGMSLYLGYAYEGYWDETQVPSTAAGMAASIDGDDMVIVGEQGMVVRRKESMVEILSLAYPPSFASCTGRDPATGRLVMEDDFNGAAVDEAFFFFQPERCSSAVRVRRSDLCVSAIEDQGPGRASIDRRALLGSWGDTIVTGGPAGLLLEVLR